MRAMRSSTGTARCARPCKPPGAWACWRTAPASIRTSARAAGHCVLLSSHVMQEVSALCDELVVIAHGTVLASGTPEAIRALTGTGSLEEAFVALTSGSGAA